MTGPKGRAVLGLALLATLAALLLPAASAAPGGQGQRTPRGVDPGRLVPELPGGFIGSDGRHYHFAPTVVPGRNGELFIGSDFDTACGDGGAFGRGLRHLASLAHVIEASGRRVRFTVVPNKSSVLARPIMSHLPHGGCTHRGMVREERTLGRFHDRDYVAVDHAFARARGQLYWHTDTHWTTVGASIFAQHLAAHIGSALARRQHYVATTRTKLGDLEQLRTTAPVPETEPARLPDNGVTVSTAPGSPGFDPVDLVTFDHSWTSSPARLTLPGQTLVLGDSFSYLGLESLRVLFHHGRYLWWGENSVNTELDAIRTAHTVVIELVQRYVSGSPILTRRFRHDVRQTLARR